MEPVFGEYPKLNRFCKTMAKVVVDNTKLVVESYNGDVSKIWKSETEHRIIEVRLKNFCWISQKKSSMATNILIRDFHIPANATKRIDISFDRQARRVFLRTALVNEGSEKEVIMKTRLLNLEYLGELDLLAWIIDRDHCY